MDEAKGEAVFEAELPDEVTQSEVPLRPRRRQGAARVIGALVATLIVVSLLLVQVWSRYRVLNLGYELAGVTAERETLLEQNRRLRIELRMLERRDRLEPVARRDLGMTYARPDQVWYVPAEVLPLPVIPASAAGLSTGVGGVEGMLVASGGDHGLD